MKEQMVTVVDVNGQTIGSYPVVLGGEQATREMYEEEALKSARANGISEERLKGATILLQPTEKPQAL